MCCVPFSIRKIYKSDEVCDVVDMNACHLLVGKAWWFNVDAVLRGRDNTYAFWYNSKKVCMVPLTNKKNNSKIEGNNFLAFVKGHLEDDCDGYKKLEKEEEFGVKTIPDKVQPLLAEFADITPSEMPNGLLL